MDKARVLKWEHWDEDLWTADTTVDAYNVQQHDYRDGSTKYEASCNNEWPRDIGAFDTPDAAMDACEADYIARCSEFLRVAGPGECVVKAADLETALNELRDLCGPDCTSVAKLTAAIAAFCHPAHLHTYDPQTQVVICREAGKLVLAFAEQTLANKREMGTWGKCPEVDELRAALEVE